MTRKTKASKPDNKQIGKLAPQHTFFLNPYPDIRYSFCPQCNGKTKLRKNPFLVHIMPAFPTVLNMTGPYCPKCDLLILHQDKVEQMLVAACELHGHPEVVGNEYLVVGIVERSYFRAAVAGQLPEGTLFDYLRDFKRHVTFEPSRWTWAPAEPESPPKGRKSAGLAKEDS